MRKVNSSQGTSAPGVIHYSIKQELCQICPSKKSCLRKPPIFVTLLCNKWQSRDELAPADAELSPQILEHLISRFLEAQAKDMASDPKMCLSVCSSAVVDKAGSLERTHLGQVLRTNSEAVVIAICRCLPPAKRLMKIRNDQVLALCEAGRYPTIVALMARSPSQKPPN